jgi:rhodanese-related sulfurtransferase
VADAYIKEGYTNIKVLAGGVEAWKKAGYRLIGDTKKE